MAERSFSPASRTSVAAATLATSINYPLRGAVAWKSVVGTNVASDALSNIASSRRLGLLRFGCRIWNLFVRQPEPTLPRHSKSFDANA